jgi:hypothetical protein
VRLSPRKPVFVLACCAAALALSVAAVIAATTTVETRSFSGTYAERGKVKIRAKVETISSRHGKTVKVIRVLRSLPQTAMFDSDEALMTCDAGSGPFNYAHPLGTPVENNKFVYRRKGITIKAEFTNRGKQVSGFWRYHKRTKRDECDTGKLSFTASAKIR